ncbi:S26 family signal peptidase [Streptomyces sp. IBSBF 2806]|uniref:S26 family signal peptidase n=1 Tax=Streptomyces sp. IBSBF 2806 TaxID=2903529 RepID=UPI002FDC3FF3
MTWLIAAAAMTAVLLAAARATLAWVRRAVVLVLVHGRSMSPAYLPGDWVVGRRVAAARLRRGDVVIVDMPPTGRAPEGHTPLGRLTIKRIAALPGDALPAGVPGGGPGAPVPAGHVVVLGDNQALSTDSRHHGPVPSAWVVGRAVRKAQLPGMRTVQPRDVTRKRRSGAVKHPSGAGNEPAAPSD